MLFACALGALAFAAPAACRAADAAPQSASPSSADRVQPDDRGTLNLLPDTAALSGGASADTARGNIPYIGHWDAGSSARWVGKVADPGEYAIMVTYGCASEGAGATFSVTVNGQTVTAKTKATGRWGDFNSVTIGAVHIKEAGDVTVVLKPVKLKGDFLFTLRDIALKPSTDEQVKERMDLEATPTLLPRVGSAAAEPLDIDIDACDAPDLENWAANARVYAAKWYPIIAGRLKTAGFTPPRHFILRLNKNYKGVAATSGLTINFSVTYVKQHPRDVGMVAHEMTHVIQHYARYDPVWLVEGIADWARYYVVEPGSKQGRFNINRASYKQGYQAASAFLNWMELKYKKPMVETFNDDLRHDTFKMSLFKDMTGKDVDELWTDFKADTLAKTAPSPTSGQELIHGKGN
jgi:hypothetical protein